MHFDPAFLFSISQGSWPERIPVICNAYHSMILVSNDLGDAKINLDTG